jgi:hypothetical protein
MFAIVQNKLIKPFFGLESAPRWPTVLNISAMLIVALFIAALGTTGTLAGVFLLKQDMQIGLIAIAMLVFLSTRETTASAAPLAIPSPAKLTIFGVALLLLGGWLGFHAIMHSYHLSRDEQMAVQDAAIFADGKFLIPLPQEWRDISATLQRSFNSIIFNPDLTISCYRPGNAFAHALMGKFGLMNLTAPLFAALGLVATWRVSRRLWPDDTSLQAMSVVFYLCSTQMWAATMTTYAMSMLLGLNMIWLALFLRRDWIGYLFALPVGFFAISAHQVPYHLMFAAPFIAVYAIERRWRVALVYGAAYTAFGLFWLRWEDFVSFMMGGGVLKSASQTIADSILDYIPDDTGPGKVAFIAASIMRFLTWQHLLTLPLILIATRAALRDRNTLLLAMIAACALPLVVKFLQVPHQGHGWGYRYLHGSIGLTCLLAVAGWQELRRHGLASARDFRVATAVTLLVAAPWLLWNGSAFSGSYATVDQALRGIDSDIVVVDSRAAPFGDDLVTNRANLTNRPIRVTANKIREHDIAALCKMGSITLFSGEKLAPIGRYFDTDSGSTPEFVTVARQFKTTCPAALR